MHLVQNGSTAEIVWDESPVKLLDPSANDRLQQKVWQKPAKWNQGGDDAVYVINEKCIRFVQVTCSCKQSFKIQYFAQLLHNLKDCDSFSHIEIVFVVPSQILQSFDISDVTGEGLLCTFKVAGSDVYWQKGKETPHLLFLGLK